MKDSDTTEYEAHTDLSPDSVTAQLEGDDPEFCPKIRFSKRLCFEMSVIGD